MKLRALALLAPMLLMLVPATEAAAPTVAPGFPYNAVGESTAVALAREGTTVAVALGPASVSTGSGSLPTVPSPGETFRRTDLAVLSTEYGFARNVTTTSVVAPGRTHVAVSDDGAAIASLGRDGGSQQSAEPQLWYGRVPAGGNWTTSQAYERRVTLVGNATALGMSADGSRVAALMRDATGYVLYGWTYSGATLDAAFEVRAPGTARGLAWARDLSRLVVVGQFPEGNATYGAAFLYSFGGREPLASFYDRTANGSELRGAALSGDAGLLALGAADGRVLLFRGARDAFAEPVILATGATPAANVTFSEDGARLAVANGMTLTHLDTTAATPRVVWNATVPGQNITGLSYNRTGGILVVGASGSGGGAFAYSDVDAEPIWRLLGDTRGVAIDRAGARVAYAQRALVSAAVIPRAFTLELATGGKEAPQRSLTVPGSTVFELTLRNLGAAPESIAFETAATEVSVSTTPAVIVVKPDAIQRVNLTVSATSLVGARIFNVSARALSSGLVENVTLSIAPQPTLDVKLRLNETQVIARPGETSSILVGIVNNGTVDVGVGLRVTQSVTSGPAWNLTLGQNGTITALRGTRTNVHLSITPPTNVENGTTSVVDVVLEGANVSDRARVTFRINPTLGVEVNATGITRFIEPGKRAVYNVTVTNTGTLPRQFEAYYTVTTDDGLSWGVDMQAQTFNLDALAKRNIPVTVVAPADAQPNQRVSVMVFARSLPEQANETIVTDNVTLYAIAIPPKPTTTTPTGDGIPGPAPLAVVAAALVVALLARRRRS